MIHNTEHYLHTIFHLPPVSGQPDICSGSCRWCCSTGHDSHRSRRCTHWRLSEESTQQSGKGGRWPRYLVIWGRSCKILMWQNKEVTETYSYAPKGQPQERRLPALLLWPPAQPSRVFVPRLRVVDKLQSPPSSGCSRHPTSQLLASVQQAQEQCWYQSPFHRAHLCIGLLLAIMEIS